MKFQDREVEALHRKGYQIEQLTPYQFRVECVLDLYPRRRRFHNIANQARGEYPYRFCGPVKELAAFVDEQVKAADAILDKAIASGQLDVTGAGDGQRERRKWLSDNNPIWWTKYTKVGA